MTDARTETRDRRLTELIGEQLSAVTFVRNYIQLHFDGPRLDAVTLPFVRNGGKCFQPMAEGYRDALCGQIAKKVVEAYVHAGSNAVIEFSDGSSLCIPLSAESYVGPEAIIYWAGEPDQCWVW